MRKEVKTKKITIDKLAMMVANGFESIEAKMATQNDIKELKEEITGVKNQLEGTNKRIDDLAMYRVNGRYPKS